MYLKIMVIAEGNIFNYIGKTWHEINNLMKMDLVKIPVKLHRLIPMVEKWGINDDGEREEKIW